MQRLSEDGQLLFWLGKATRQMREEAKLYRSEIVGDVPCDVGVLIGFEKGESWPRERDRIWEILAKKAQLDGPHEILRRAADLWEKDAKSRG